MLRSFFVYSMLFDRLIIITPSRICINLHIKGSQIHYLVYYYLVKYFQLKEHAYFDIYLMLPSSHELEWRPKMDWVQIQKLGNWQQFPSITLQSGKRPPALQLKIPRQRHQSITLQSGFLNIIIVNDVKQSLTLSGEERNNLQNSGLFLLTWTE